MTTDKSITHLISFLIRPLILTHTPATILTLQLYLQATFSSFTAPTLTISPNSRAPPQMHNACLAAGVSWVDWISLLCPDGRALQLIISKTAIHARVPGTPGLLTIWRAQDDEHLTLVPISKTSNSSITSFRSRLQATLASARVRRKATEFEPMAIRIPSLLQAVHDDDDGDSNSDSDSESDSDSVSSFASHSSLSSATTVTTASSACIPSHSATVPPHVDRTKTTVTEYMYQGGVTKVMTGGVMLGNPSLATAKYVPRPLTRPVATGKAPSARRSRAASTADNWRRGVGVTM